MNCQTIIQVAEILGNTIHTRDAAKQLLSVVAADPCAQTELDFSEVTYISRSFADQFHSDKLQLIASSQKQIIVTNANEEVVNMLQAVAKTQNKSYQNSSLPVFKYSNWNQLENYLLSI
jgi:hypothetical protein